MTIEVETPGEPDFVALVFATIDNPHTVDRSALTRSADEILTDAHGGCPDWLHSVRAVAGAAFAFGMFGTRKEYEQLEAAAYGATLMLGLHRHHDH